MLGGEAEGGRCDGTPFPLSAVKHTPMWCCLKHINQHPKEAWLPRLSVSPSSYLQSPNQEHVFLFCFSIFPHQTFTNSGTFQVGVTETDINVPSRNDIRQVGVPIELLSSESQRRATGRSP